MAPSSSDACALEALGRIHEHLPKETYILKDDHDSPVGKAGIRTLLGNRVVLIWKSYRKNALDTRAELAPALSPWFSFQPTHNKPEYYYQVFEHGVDLLNIAKKHAAEIAKAIQNADSF
jgi:hypothetical protein